jgi:hypothetical protein
MAHIIDGVLPVLLFFASIDLCFLGGEYTYWIVSAAISIVP